MSNGFKVKDFRHWSPWINMKKHDRISCCDCGLVHELDVEPVPHGKKFSYRMRVKVRPGETAALRKAKTFTCQPV